MVGHSLSFASAVKDSTGYFVWVLEAADTKPEHGYEIKTDRFWLGNSYTNRANYDLSDGQESDSKIIDSMKN